MPDDVMTMIRTGLPPKTSITFHTDLHAHFRAADFYEGEIATVTGPEGTVQVSRQGRSELESPEDDIRTFAQFRELFPDGVLPLDEEPFAADVTTEVEPGGSIWSWVNNAWFSLVFGDDPDDDVCQDVFEAVDAAITLASHGRTPSVVPPVAGAAPAAYVPPATQVTLWTLTMKDPNSRQAFSAVFYTEAQVSNFLRESYAEGEDVTDDDLEEFLISQGLDWSVDTATMDTTRMRN